MRSATKTLAFPLAGVSRRGAYRQQTPPFTCPWAVNVRTRGTEGRKRGGSRPGLSKFCESDLGEVTALIPVTYVDSDGNRQHDLVYVADGALGYVRGGVASSPVAELLTDDGDPILTDDDETIEFGSAVSAARLQGVERAGRVYLADSVLRTYDPRTGVVEDVVATAGVLPAGEPLIALYRDRILLAGSSQAYYASRVSDPTDWDFGAAMEDPSAAVAGQLSEAGRMGAVLTAMVPFRDRALVLATANALWLLRGDPVTGTLRQVSDELGIVDQGAWAMSPDGLLCFLSNDGVCLWAPGGEDPPRRFSAERLPDELREVDPSLVTVSMSYDPDARGFHLFLTPAEGTGYHWWIDVDNRAMWPQRFAEAHQPLAAALVSGAGLGTVVLASRDGFLRRFDVREHEDDGEPLTSHVLIGPVSVATDDVRDALLAEIHGAMEELTSQVTWAVVMGRSAAEASEAAQADLEAVLAGGEATHVAASGSWGEGRGRVQRPRARGPWAVVWLSSSGSWSYELVALVVRHLGRFR